MKIRIQPEFALSILALTVAIGTAVFTYLQVREAEMARQQQHDDAMQTLRQNAFYDDLENVLQQLRTRLSRGKS